ncbi:MAG: hypothetical protein V4487_02010 [Chlamydiota bacterium]
MGGVNSCCKGSILPSNIAPISLEKEVRLALPTMPSVLIHLVLEYGTERADALWGKSKEIRKAAQKIFETSDLIEILGKWISYTQNGAEMISLDSLPDISVDHKNVSAAFSRVFSRDYLNNFDFLCLLDLISFTTFSERINSFKTLISFDYAKELITDIKFIPFIFEDETFTSNFEAIDEFYKILKTSKQKEIAAKAFVEMGLMQIYLKTAKHQTDQGPTEQFVIEKFFKKEGTAALNAEGFISFLAGVQQFAHERDFRGICSLLEFYSHFYNLEDENLHQLFNRPSIYWRPRYLPKALIAKFFKDPNDLR